MNAIVDAKAPSPDWLDRQLYPFKSRWANVQGAKLHYVDEGQGPVLLMLHGNGSWSFGFRRTIPILSKHFRCIAVDHAGFGLSTACPGFSFKPADHSALIEAFVDQLKLQDLRLMVEDWGGPIGLGLAGRRPELIHTLFIGNTWAWPAQGIPQLERFSKMAGSPIGQFLIMRFNALTRFAVPNVGMNRKLTRAERAGYTGPYPTPNSRRPQAIFPKEILASRDYLATVEAGLAKLRDKPALLLWADSDSGFGEAERQRFEQLLPKAETVTLRNARHFAHEDAPEELSDAVMRFEAAGVNT